MKTIYFSSSITGVQNLSEDFQTHILNHMRTMGFKVLSEHIILRDSIEMFRVFSENSGTTITQRDGNEQIIRKTDMSWVDSADYFIAFVDGPSLGVGMEIERALLRVDRGLKPIPILCLIRQDNTSTLSAMVKGVKSPHFSLMTYTDEQNAIDHITNFLNT